MLTVCEPYALWAIQTKPKAWRSMEHPAIRWTADVMPYSCEKYGFSMEAYGPTDPGQATRLHHCARER